MAQESYPQDLKYFKEHDWVRVEGGEATFGITWWAQDALGDMVYASLPDVGAAVSSGQPYGELESVKSVAEIYAPVSGEVVAANDALVGPKVVPSGAVGQIGFHGVIERPACADQRATIARSTPGEPEITI